MMELFVNFFLAIFGGLLMNFMPCILPFISIKISSFISSSDCRKKFILNNLSYAFGITSFFITLATVLFIVQKTGNTIFFGSYMQSPLFLLVAFFVLLFVALNLIGLFEFALPINFGRLDGFIAKSHWFLKSFLSGFFISLFAISCTAPFIVTAVTYGLANPRYLFILMLGMAIGFALPFILAIFYFNRISKFLPKSGEWMIKFRKLVSLPIFGCLLWLLFIMVKQGSYTQIGIAFSFGFGLIVFFVIKSLFHNLFYRRIVNNIVLCSIIICFSYFCLPNSRLEKQIFTYSGFQEAINNHKKMIVVTSASWCITCHLNEFNVFNKSSFKDYLAHKGVVYMYIDLTNSNEEGLKFLHEYKRSGVPLYVIFDSEGQYEILPQILTKQLVVEKINKLT